MRELALHILDIVQNSIAAEAEVVEVTIKELPAKNSLTITIEDDGSGMTKEESKKAVDPFVTSRDTRTVGLGLPLLKRAAKECGGDFKLDSKPGLGTTVEASFELDHIDRAPLGDMVSTLITILNSNPDLDFIYYHQVGEESFVFNTREIKEELEGVEINNRRILNWIKEYLEENLAELRR